MQNPPTIRGGCLKACLKKTWNPWGTGREVSGFPANNIKKQASSRKCCRRPAASRQQAATDRSYLSQNGHLRTNLPKRVCFRHPPSSKVQSLFIGCHCHWYFPVHRSAISPCSVAPALAVPPGMMRWVVKNRCESTTYIPHQVSFAAYPAQIDRWTPAGCIRDSARGGVTEVRNNLVPVLHQRAPLEIRAAQGATCTCRYVSNRY